MPTYKFERGDSVWASAWVSAAVGGAPGLLQVLIDAPEEVLVQDVFSLLPQLLHAGEGSGCGGEPGGRVVQRLRLLWRASDAALSAHSRRGLVGAVPLVALHL